MEPNFNILELLKTIFKWKKYIIYICAAASIGSLIISLILPVYYTSTTTFFAASPDQTKPELLYGSQGYEVKYYGNRNDIDRIMTISESDELKNFLIDSFDLYQHYKIDTANVKAPYNIRLELADHFDLKKTSKDALVLSIEDKDKNLAAQMAKASREKIDEIAKKLITESQAKMLTAINNNIESKELLLSNMNQELLNLRKKYGVYNTDTQAESLALDLNDTQVNLASDSAQLIVLEKNPRISRDTISMLKARIEGRKQQLFVLNKNMKLFNEGLSEVLNLEQQFVQLSRNLSKDKEKKTQYEATYKAGISAVILVEEAEVPIIKSRPLRKLIILGSVVLAFILSVLGVLIFEYYSGVNWKEIYHADKEAK